MNRAQKIDDQDRDQITSENPYHFWINDDEDSAGEGAVNEYDVPGSANMDAADRNVNTLRDLLDFYPVYVDLRGPLEHLGKADYRYYLRMEDLNAAEDTHIMYTDLNPAQSGLYLTDPTTATNAANGVLWSLQDVGPYEYPHGVRIPELFLDRISQGKGIILVEHAAAMTNAALAVRITDDQGRVLAEQSLNLSISGIEAMFTHKDLRGVVANDLDHVNDDWTGEPADRYINASPPNYPDTLTNDKAFVFIHGYNNNLRCARGSHAEMFKRLFHSGSHAKYYGVSWYGYQEQLDLNLIFLGWKTPNYHGNVFNAFKTASAYANYVAGISKSKKYVAAHSLGNMVVCSAIQDFSLQVDKYFMINAAVAAEAFSAVEEPVIQDMVHVDWGPYLGTPPTGSYENLFCYNWYKLFPDTDSRSTLTWNGRFANVASVAYNFWSKGDLTFAKHPHSENPGTWPGVNTILHGSQGWCKQEKRKGRAVDFKLWPKSGGSIGGGWGFNSFHSNNDHPELLLQSTLRTEPFFRKGELDLVPEFSDLFDPDQTAFVDDFLTHSALLASFIPAKRFALGATENVLGLESERQFEMQHKFNSGAWHDMEKYANGKYWNHGDFKVVAMPYVHRFYEHLIIEGELKDD